MNEHELESTLQQALRFDFSADAKAFSNALLSRCLAELQPTTRTLVPENASASSETFNHNGKLEA